MAQLEVLPIDGRMNEIMVTLQDHQVEIVEAETGAGKTTRIPQAALEVFPGEVVMTQTRRNAVRWNGFRIAEELDCNPGETVGWQLRGEKPMVSDATRLTLVMDQSLTNRIRRMGRLPEGLIIVDEAHERSVSVDLLLGLIKQYLPMSPNTKVLVTSATIDTEKFSQYFDNAPIISVKGRMYPVETEVVYLHYGEHHTEGAARAGEIVLERFGKGTLSVAGGGKVVTGMVSVLLPGKDDIAAVMARLSQTAEQLDLTERVQILPYHSESPPEEQDAVQQPVPQGTLRVVCATEVLRSAVTVRGQVGSIDSLQVKRLIVDAHGVAHLTKMAVSQAEADQGKGRAGRTQPGFYMPVSFNDEYYRLEPYPQPAILREPIAHVVLQVAAAGLDVRTFPFLDRPADDHVEAAIRRLQRLDALNEQEAITQKGRQLLKFPLDPERAMVILAAEELGVLPEAIVVSAILNLGNTIFFWPKQEKIGVNEATAREVISHVERKEWGWTRCYPARSPETVDLTDLPPWTVRKGNAYELDCAHYDFPLRDAREVVQLIHRQWRTDQSDFAMIVRVYRAFKVEERKLRKADAARRQARATQSKPSKQGSNWESLLREWCKHHFLSFKHLRMAEQVMREIRSELSGADIELQTSLSAVRDFDTSSLSKALVAGLVDNLAVKIEYGKGFRFTGGSFGLSYESACPQDSPVIVVGGIRKTRRGGFYADLAAPLTWNIVREAAPRLLEVKTGLYPRFDANRDEVVSTTETWFNGQIIERREVLDPNHTEANQLRREGRNTRQWQNWADRPEIVLPDPADDSAEIPEIVVCAYGMDVETDTPLVAYGAVAPYGYRYSSDPWFKILWTRDNDEAERSRQESVSRLESIRAEAKAAAERQRLAIEVQQLKQAAEPLRQRVYAMFESYYYGYGFAEDLRHRLYKYSQLPYTSDPEAVRQWMVEAEALVAEVETAVVVAEAQKAEANRRLAELVETARSLRDEVNSLLVDHGDEEFTDALYAELFVFDVNNDELPSDETDLEDWITVAKAKINEARAYLQAEAGSRSVNEDSLAALMAKFNK